MENDGPHQAGEYNTLYQGLYCEAFSSGKMQNAEPLHTFHKKLIKYYINIILKTATCKNLVGSWSKMTKFYAWPSIKN